MAVLLSVMLMLPLGPGRSRLNSGFFDLLSPAMDDPNSDHAVAAKMSRLGLHQERIAALYFSNLGMSNWAHLAGVRIIAEVYYWPGRSETLVNDFWAADPTTQERLSRFSRRRGQVRSFPRKLLAVHMTLAGLKLEDRTITFIGSDLVSTIFSQRSESP